MRFRYIRCEGCRPRHKLPPRQNEPARPARRTPDTAPPRCGDAAACGCPQIPGAGRWNPTPRSFTSTMQQRPPPVLRHQIQFPEPAAPLAGQQGIPLLPQIAGHRRLAPVSGALGLTHGVWPPTFSGRSSGAPGRGRTDPASHSGALCRSPCALQTDTGDILRPAPWTHTGPG